MKAIILILGWLGSATVLSAWSGTISGALIGEDGSVLDQGQVSLRLTSSKFKNGQTDWNVISSVQGAFRFDGLPTGEYSLCARAATGTWLNPCEWGLAVPRLSITNRQPIAKVDVILKKGVVIPIRVNDPGQRLPVHEGKTAGAGLLIGIGSSGLVFHRASTVSTDSTGRNYQIIAPYDTPLKLVVRSSFFQVNDSLGLSLSRAGATAIPFIVAPGKAAIIFNFTITGTDR